MPINAQNNPTTKRRQNRKKQIQSVDNPQKNSVHSSKHEQLITLLNGDTGASIDELMQATGWQAHSVRGAISGYAKKKRGFVVESTRNEERGRIYRIVNAK